MIFQGIASGLLMVSSGVATALFVVAIARRCVSRDAIRKTHEITGSLLSLVGTLYAVLLGLVVVDALVRFEAAIDVVQDESNVLADIFMLAKRLPESRRIPLQTSCRTYARLVVDEEWPLQAQCAISPKARDTAFEIANSLDGFEPVKESEKAVYPMLLEQIRQLWDHRRERTSTAMTGIPAIEWFVLIVGGLVTVLMAGLFSTESFGLQWFLTGLAALIICLNLYLVSLFGYPYAGDLFVSSRPFEVDIALFDGQAGGLPLPADGHPPR